MIEIFENYLKNKSSHNLISAWEWVDSDSVKLYSPTYCSSEYLYSLLLQEIKNFNFEVLDKKIGGYSGYVLIRVIS